MAYLDRPERFNLVLLVEHLGAELESLLRILSPPCRADVMALSGQKRRESSGSGDRRFESFLASQHCKVSAADETRDGLPPQHALLSAAQYCCRDDSARPTGNRYGCCR
jgi:hypothetical protein